jgi:hypothetical protein
MENEVKIQEVKPSHTNRRDFLKIGITMVSAGLLLAGCSKDNDAGPSNKLPGLKNGVFDLGSGDFGC